MKISIICGLLLIFVLIVSCNSSKKTTQSTQKPEVNSLSGVDSDEGNNLINKYKCTTCHKLDKHSMGPAYVAIAQKYMPTTQNVKYLMSKISNGGSGTWGKAKMNAHKNISPKDLEKMSLFILSLHHHSQDLLPENNLKDNTLTGLEKAQGWQLLFEGKSLSGWRNFRKYSIGKSWVIDDNAIHLKAEKSPEGPWQASDGGDIITDKTYSNYILKYDWKISDCGNSGVMFNVIEDEKYDFVWQTGPEMQVLDNNCHPDAKIKTHRAGDLFDMLEAKPESVLPPGEWNQALIKNTPSWVEFWLNGVKIIEFSIHDETWKKRIKSSKFKDMPGFGLSKSGHIALQDHGDKVWFKNIKIKTLNP